MHLDENMACRLFGDRRRPALCDAFAPHADYCGDNREQAMLRLAALEQDTLPVIVPAESV